MCFGKFDMSGPLPRMQRNIFIYTFNQYRVRLFTFHALFTNLSVGPPVEPRDIIGSFQMYHAEGPHPLGHMHAGGFQASLNGCDTVLHSFYKCNSESDKYKIQ